MKKFNKKAFNILTNDEQSSLALQKVHGKSTWEAGSILNRSHYKYLEIKQRAERFFELFSLHYDTYGTLIPTDLISVNEVFELYIIYTIEKRMPVKKAAAKIGLSMMTNKKEREEFLAKEITKLKNSNSLVAQNLYTVIMEFDRYNNFRILPLSVQEPSAFKRRNKTRYRKHLTISTTIHPYVLMRIKELYEISARGAKAKLVGYIALTNYSDQKSFEKVIPIPVNDKTIKELSSISIYIFPKEEYAVEYINLVREYILASDKDPKMGLKFWPQFRVIIKDSLNYNEINNIAPSRRGLLSALKDLDDRHLKARKIAQYNNSFK